MRKSGAVKRQAVVLSEKNHDSEKLFERSIYFLKKGVFRVGIVKRAVTRRGEREERKTAVATGRRRAARGGAFSEEIGGRGRKEVSFPVTALMMRMLCRRRGDGAGEGQDRRGSVTLARDRALDVERPAASGRAEA